MNRFIAITIGIWLAFSIGAARADLVTDWNVTALRITQQVDAPGSVQARALAMMHVAMSDAVNTVQNRFTRLMTTEPLAPDLSPDALSTGRGPR